MKNENRERGMQQNKEKKYADVIISQGHFYCGTVITQHVTDMGRAASVQLQVLLISSGTSFYVGSLRNENFTGEIFALYKF